MTECPPVTGNIPDEINTLRDVLQVWLLGIAGAGFKEEEIMVENPIFDDLCVSSNLMDKIHDAFEKQTGRKNFDVVVVRESRVSEHSGRPYSVRMYGIAREGVLEFVARVNRAGSCRFIGPEYPLFGFCEIETY